MRCNSTAIRPLAAVVAALSLSLLACPWASAQSRDKTETELLADFIFYVQTANPELAASNARALLDSGISPEQFVNLIDDDPRLSEQWDQAYREAMLVGDLEALAAGLANLYEGGRRARARNPEEIKANIELLTGTARQQLLGWDRLKEAGEYALPYIYERFSDGRDLFLRAQLRELLIDMGNDAVGPLVAALPNAQPEVQERIANVLGAIRYRRALPALAELSKTTDNEAVRRAADIAIRQIGGDSSIVNDPAAAYAELAEFYFRDRRSAYGTFISFPGEDYQLVWELNPQGELLQTAIRTEVYHETMAMLNASRALTLDASNDRALAVLLAADFARVLDEPEGWGHPLFGDDPRDPTFYVVAAGSGPSQRALALALSENDTLLARQLIGAMSRSAGGVGLWNGVEGSKPLAGALSYPDRRVRYEAAIALGGAAPKAHFEGAERVVPTLSAAVRDAAARFAVVVAADIQRQQDLLGALEGDGYTVLPPARDLASIRQAIATAPGIDFIAIDQDPITLAQTMREVRSDAKLAATPVLAFMSLRDRETHGARYRDDPLTRLARPGTGMSEFVVGANDLVETVAGAPVGADEARDYAMRSLSVLGEIAASGDNVFSVTDAGSSLIASLEETEGEVQLMVATVVSSICESRGQIALLDAALSESDPDQQVALLARVVDSAHRCGNLAENRQVDRLRNLIGSDEVGVATAAAAAAGALGLPNDQVVPLLLDR